MPWYYLVPSGFAAPEVPKENHLGEMKQKGENIPYPKTGMPGA